MPSAGDREDSATETYRLEWRRGKISLLGKGAKVR